MLRSLLGTALQPNAASTRGARIVFATLPGERHELGLLMAALTAMGAGANPIYLGPELPVEDLLDSAARCRAAAVGVSVVHAQGLEIARSLAALGAGLPPGVRLWIGGAGSDAIALPRNALRIVSLDRLEQQVSLLELETRPS